MKRLALIMIWVAALSLLLMVPNSHATPLAVGDSIRLYDGPGTTNGGEFLLQHKEGGSWVYNFNTFCLETDEYISYGTSYIIDAISTQAWAGGANTNSGDPLDARTAYLFWHFTVGDLQGYDYGSGRNASANALQNAIWYIEQEITSPGSAALTFVHLAEDAISSGEWSGLGGVRVLNLVDASGNLKQDQLYATVPEPATMLLLGSGLIGLAGWGRRKIMKNV